MNEYERLEDLLKSTKLEERDLNRISELEKKRNDLESIKEQYESAAAKIVTETPAVAHDIAYRVYGHEYVRHFLNPVLVETQKEAINVQIRLSEQSTLTFIVPYEGAEMRYDLKERDYTAGFDNPLVAGGGVVGAVAGAQPLMSWINKMPLSPEFMIVGGIGMLPVLTASAIAAYRYFRRPRGPIAEVLTLDEEKKHMILKYLKNVPQYLMAAYDLHIQGQETALAERSKAITRNLQDLS